ncbi:hypothetical protein Taro_006503 [Colocasia esculenta]|uniref:Uncharacterized protein n=1 Tax=Colocasia esculenta TaxID=4460 RepID=A0A843U0Z3_COLES|nr:hypothetical protein [Colocasia esculenta]
MASRGGSHSVALCPVWHLVPALPAGFTQFCHSGVDTVHLCVDTSSLSQKPVLNGRPVVSTQSTCVSTLGDCPRKQSKQLKPVVSTQSALSPIV